MLSELRDLLNLLDDVEIEQLCIVHFPAVADKLGHGMGKQEKINLLLDHCRRYPREGERLREILRESSSSQGVGTSPRSVPDGGNTTTIIGNGNTQIAPSGELLRHNELSPVVYKPSSPIVYNSLLRALLELVYWYWLTQYHPDQVRSNLNSEVTALILEIGTQNVVRWFGQPPRNAAGQLDVSEQTRARLLAKAYRKTQNDDLNWRRTYLMSIINGELVKWLRETDFYGAATPQKYYQDYTDHEPSWDSLKDKSQPTIAEKLVRGAICKNKLV